MAAAFDPAGEGAPELVGTQARGKGTVGPDLEGVGGAGIETAGKAVDLGGDGLLVDAREAAVLLEEVADEDDRAVATGTRDRVDVEGGRLDEAGLRGEAYDLGAGEGGGEFLGSGLQVIGCGGEDDAGHKIAFWWLSSGVRYSVCGG